MQLRQLVSQLSQRFAEAGIESAPADAEILVAHVLGLGRGELAARLIIGEEVAANNLDQILTLAERRSAREPLQHLTGVAHFRNLELQVGPGVFVPRPETELLAQLAIDFLSTRPLTERKAADLATGSGAVALAIATEVPGASVKAIELSSEAIAWSSKNFAKYRALGADAELIQGDLRDALPELAGQLDLLVSNPPYIPDDMVPIYPEVALHDPKLALYGGPDGLDLVRALSQTALRLTKPGAFFALEHADIQGPSVVELLTKDGWTQVRLHQDLNQRDRVTSAIRP